MNSKTKDISSRGLVKAYNHRSCTEGPRGLFRRMGRDDLDRKAECNRKSWGKFPTQRRTNDSSFNCDLEICAWVFLLQRCMAEVQLKLGIDEAAGPIYEYVLEFSPQLGTRWTPPYRRANDVDCVVDCVATRRSKMFTCTHILMKWLAMEWCVLYPHACASVEIPWSALFSSCLTLAPTPHHHHI